jgi:hypothetical protein
MSGNPLLAPFVPSQEVQWSPTRVEQERTRCEVAGVGRFPSAMGPFFSQAPPPHPSRCTSRPLVVFSFGKGLQTPRRAVGADGRRVSALLMQGPNLFDFRRFLPTRGTSAGPNNVEGSLNEVPSGGGSQGHPKCPKRERHLPITAQRKKAGEPKLPRKSFQPFCRFLQNSPG